MTWLRRKIRLFAFALLRRTEYKQAPPERFEDVSQAAQAWLAVHEITDRCMQSLVNKLVNESEVLRLRAVMTEQVSRDNRCVWQGQRFVDHCALGLWMQNHQLNAVWYPRSNLGHRWLAIGARQGLPGKQEVLRS